MPSDPDLSISSERRRSSDPLSRVERAIDALDFWESSDADGLTPISLEVLGKHPVKSNGQRAATAYVAPASIPPPAQGRLPSQRVRLPPTCAVAPEPPAAADAVPDGKAPARRRMPSRAALLVGLAAPALSFALLQSDGGTDRAVLRPLPLTAPAVSIDDRPSETSERQTSPSIINVPPSEASAQTRPSHATGPRPTAVHTQGRAASEAAATRNPESKQETLPAPSANPAPSASFESDRWFRKPH